jgi:hypothetical protein
LILAGDRLPQVLDLAPAIRLFIGPVFGAHQPIEAAGGGLIVFRLIIFRLGVIGLTRSGVVIHRLRLPLNGL